jgi:hypothetical protein
MKPIRHMPAGAKLPFMSIRAKVSSGRIIVDQPTLLPEGMTLNLVVDDEGDDLDDEERSALSAHLAASWKSALAGNVRPASELLAELRSKRR